MLQQSHKSERKDFISLVPVERIDKRHLNIEAFFRDLPVDGSIRADLKGSPSKQGPGGRNGHKRRSGGPRLALTTRHL
jgi:hypothetical protein